MSLSLKEHIIADIMLAILGIGLIVGSDMTILPMVPDNSFQMWVAGFFFLVIVATDVLKALQILEILKVLFG